MLGAHSAHYLHILLPTLQYAQGSGEPFPVRRRAHGGAREPAEGGEIPR